MNNQKKALLVALAVAGVSISGPMVKWSLSCGASPVMIAFGRMAISFLLLLVPALRSGELQAILRAPKKQVALACAAGLAVGAGFDAALRWAQGRSACGWALLCACACIAIGAEFVRTGGVPIYTAATRIGPMSITGYYWPLVVGVGLGKAVCLGMAARSLLRPWPAAALCTALLCLAWPTVFWEASSQGLEDLGAIALYAACAAGASALLCGAALGDEASLRPGRAA